MVPIVIGAVVVVVAIILIVVFVVKPSSQPAASAGSAAGSATSASAQASSSSAAADKFIGDWKLGGMEAQGVSICGDVAKMLGFGVKLSIAADGTGSLDIDNDHATFKWQQAGDDAITVSSLSGEGSLDVLDDTFNVSFKDDTLSFAIKGDGMEGSLVFSKDGNVKWMRTISMDDAKKISSEDVLSGTTWNLTGVAMQGLSMYGDADTIASFMPSSMKSTSIKFKKDGTVDFMGEEATWKITDKGNAIIKSGESKVSVKSLDDDIVMDLSEYAGTDLVMLLSKAKK